MNLKIWFYNDLRVGTKSHETIKGRDYYSVIQALCKFQNFVDRMITGRMMDDRLTN